MWLVVLASMAVCHGFTLPPSASLGKASNTAQTMDTKSSKPLWADQINVGDAVINGDDILDDGPLAMEESATAAESEVVESPEEEDPFPEATFLDKVVDEQLERDEHFMKMAIEAALEE